MTVHLTSALCLHARSSDLKFLNQTRNRLKKLLGARLGIHRLGNKASQEHAILKVRSSVNSLVVVFAHGTGDYIKGGCYRSSSTGEIEEIELFLSKTDLSLFSGKAIFCMSCDSNRLARHCIAAGALAFVGFGQIPFDRFDDKGNSTGSYVLTKHSQKLISKTVQATLQKFLLGKASLDECVDYLKLLIPKEAVTYVREMEKGGVKERKEVAALLLRVGSGVKYHGMKNIYFLRND